MFEFCDEKKMKEYTSYNCCKAHGKRNEEGSHFDLIFLAFGIKFQKFQLFNRKVKHKLTSSGKRFSFYNDHRENDQLF